MAETSFDAVAGTLNSKLIKFIRFPNFVTNANGFIILSKNDYPYINNVVFVSVGTVNGGYGYWCPPLSYDAMGNRFLAEMMRYNTEITSQITVSDVVIGYI